MPINLYCKNINKPEQIFVSFSFSIYLDTISAQPSCSLMFHSTQGCLVWSVPIVWYGCIIVHGLHGSDMYLNTNTLFKNIMQSSMCDKDKLSHKVQDMSRNLNISTSFVNIMQYRVTVSYWNREEICLMPCQLALRHWPNVGIGRHRRDRQQTSRQRWYSVARVATVCWHSVGARRLAYRSLPMFCVWTSVVGIKCFLNKCCRSTRLSIHQLHI